MSLPLHPLQMSLYFNHGNCNRVDHAGLRNITWQKRDTGTGELIHPSSNIKYILQELAWLEDNKYVQR